MPRLITVASVFGSVLLVGGLSLVSPVGCSGTLDPNATLAQLVTQLAQDPNALALLNQITVGQVLTALQQDANQAPSQSGAWGGQASSGSTQGWSGGQQGWGGGQGGDLNEEPNEPAHTPGHGHFGRGAVLLRETFNAAPFTGTFTPLASGDTITVTVAGADAGSRLTFTVIDDANNPVASVTDPNTYVSQTTFTSASTGTFTLTATETGTAATAYVAWVVETLAAPPTREVPVLLLTQLFKAAPITATFTPTAADRVIEVVVAGDNGSSRLSVEVTDPNGTTVATADSGATNVAKTTFNSTSTGTYTLTVTETGTASTTYVVHVIEQGNLAGGVPGIGAPGFGGPGFGEPGGGRGRSEGPHRGGGHRGG